MYIYYAGSAVVVLLALWSIGSYLVVRNIEKPIYTVLEKRDGYEVRQYNAYIVAETTVSGDRDKALNSGFRIIADYIFGNNVSKSSIAMTAPVLERPASEKISMTTPVLSTEGAAGDSVVAFVLPSSYTMETLPIPNNPKVILREVPSQKVAVLQFTWYATDSRIAKKKEELLSLLQRDKATIAGDMQVAQYNPPLSMPLVLRNEIIVPIE
jgi:SOUL heme-binding protein